jgi:hypothetical protein
VGEFDQVIDKGAYFEGSVFTTDVNRVQMGVPERMLHEDRTQRVFEHGIFKHHARQRGKTHTGTDGMRDRDRHQ